MENKLRDTFSDWLEKLTASDKKRKIIIALGLVGVLLLLLSEVLPTGVNKKAEEKQQSPSYSEYVAKLETDTASLISTIDGVGRCQVMITLREGTENIYARNADEEIRDGSNSAKHEYVLYDGEQGEEALLVKERFPPVQGVAVVCDGADNTVVRTCVVNTVSALFNVSVSKISVAKYKSDR